MSGHSKWSKVKHQKALEDVKRGQMFSKLSQEITAAAKVNSDPEVNPTLTSLIEKARSLNMPKENIERAIERAKGGGIIGDEEFILEAYGHGGEGLIIKGRTDNKNRTLAQIKQTLSRYSAKLVGPGGVSWNFEGNIPKMTKPASPEFHKLYDDLRTHPEVEKVLTDAIERN